MGRELLNLAEFSHDLYLAKDFVSLEFKNGLPVLNTSLISKDDFKKGFMKISNSANYTEDKVNLKLNTTNSNSPINKIK